MKSVFLSILFCALFGSILCRVKGLVIQDMRVFPSFGDVKHKSNVGEVVICYDRGSHAVSDGFSNWNMRYSRSFSFWPFARQVKFGTPLPTNSLDSDKDCIIAPVELPNGVTPNQGYKFQVVVKSSSWLPFTNQHSNWFKPSDYRKAESAVAESAELIEEFTGFCVDCLEYELPYCKTRLVKACEPVRKFFAFAKENCDACVTSVVKGVKGVRDTCVKSWQSCKKMFAQSKPDTQEFRQCTGVRCVAVAGPSLFNGKLPRYTPAPREKRVKILQRAGIDPSLYERILELSQKKAEEFYMNGPSDDIMDVAKEFFDLGVTQAQYLDISNLIMQDVMQIRGIDIDTSSFDDEPNMQFHKPTIAEIKIMWSTLTDSSFKFKDLRLEDLKDRAGFLKEAGIPSEHIEEILRISSQAAIDVFETGNPLSSFSSMRSEIMSNEEYFNAVSLLVVRDMYSIAVRNETPKSDAKRSKFLMDVGIEEEKHENILKLSEKIAAYNTPITVTFNGRGLDKLFRGVGVMPSQMSGVRALLAYDIQQRLRTGSKATASFVSGDV